LQESNLTAAIPRYPTTARIRATEIRTHNSVVENVNLARNEQMLENAVAMTNDATFIVGETVLLSNGRKRALDLTASNTQLSGPYIVTEVNPKVKLMLKSDFTQTKVITETWKLIQCREAYKLPMLEQSHTEKPLPNSNYIAMQFADSTCNGDLDHENR